MRQPLRQIVEGVQLAGMVVLWWTVIEAAPFTVPVFLALGVWCAVTWVLGLACL